MANRRDALSFPFSCLGRRRRPIFDELEKLRGKDRYNKVKIFRAQGSHNQTVAVQSLSESNLIENQDKETERDKFGKNVAKMRKVADNQDSTGWVLVSPPQAPLEKAIATHAHTRTHARERDQVSQ